MDSLLLGASCPGLHRFCLFTLNPSFRLVLEMVIAALNVGLIDMPYAIFRCGYIMGPMAIFSVYVAVLISCWFVFHTVSELRRPPTDLSDLVSLVMQQHHIRAVKETRSRTSPPLQQPPQPPPPPPRRGQQQPWGGALHLFADLFLYVAFLGLIAGCFCVIASPPDDLASKIVMFEAHSPGPVILTSPHLIPFRAVFLLLPLSLFLLLRAFNFDATDFNLLHMLYALVTSIAIFALSIYMLINLGVHPRQTIKKSGPADSLFYALHSAKLNFGPIILVWTSDMKSRVVGSRKLYISTVAALTLCMGVMLTYGLGIVATYGPELKEGLTNLPSHAQIIFYATFTAASMWVIAVLGSMLHEMLNKLTRFRDVAVVWLVRLVFFIAYIVAVFVPFLPDILVVMGSVGSVILVPTLLHASLFWGRSGVPMRILHVGVFVFGLLLFVSAPMSFWFNREKLG